jgi:hypothetical protein
MPTIFVAGTKNLARFLVLCSNTNNLTHYRKPSMFSMPTSFPVSPTKIIRFDQGESINRRSAVKIVNYINEQFKAGANVYKRFVLFNNDCEYRSVFRHYDQIKRDVIENLADPANDRNFISNLFIF